MGSLLSEWMRAWSIIAEWNHSLFIVLPSMIFSRYAIVAIKERTPSLLVRLGHSHFEIIRARPRQLNQGKQLAGPLGNNHT